MTSERTLRGEPPAYEVRADIQALRALAVIVVLAFHLWRGCPSST